MERRTRSGAVSDIHDLQRFVLAQESVYERALEEIREGSKKSHWMWFVFPQIAGLGFSDASRRYAIKGAAEAVAYLEHPLLGRRLIACCQEVLDSSDSAQQIFGSLDAMKLQSCATLFAAVAPRVPVFQRLLAAKFDGHHDRRTLELLDVAA